MGVPLSLFLWEILWWPWRMKMYKMATSLNKIILWGKKSPCLCGWLCTPGIPLWPPGYTNNRKIRDLLTGHTWPQGWNVYNPDLEPEDAKGKSLVMYREFRMVQYHGKRVRHQDLLFGIIWGEQNHIGRLRHRRIWGQLSAYVASCLLRNENCSSIVVELSGHLKSFSLSGRKNLDLFMFVRGTWWSYQTFENNRHLDTCWTYQFCLRKSALSLPSV